MWKVVSVILGLLISPASAQDDEGPMPGIKADCEAEWAGDFSMQEYCIGRQVKAYNSLVPVARDEQDEQLKGALARCLDEWETPNGQDWAMVEYCYKRQEEAYYRLSGS